MKVVPYRLLYGSEHAAFDVSDGFGVDRSKLMDQSVVQRKQGQVEEQTLSHCLFCPGGSHLCDDKHTKMGSRERAHILMWRFSALLFKVDIGAVDQLRHNKSYNLGVH